METLPVNRSIFHWINQWAGTSPVVDWAGVILGKGSPYLFLFLLLILHFLSLKRGGLPLWLGTIGAGIGATLSVLISKGLSLFIEIPRPFVVESVHLLFPHTPDNSFPSDHTAFLIGIATPLLLQYWRVGVPFFLLGVAGGIARVLAGVHWPLDILGGVGVGVLGGVVGVWILGRFKKKVEGIYRWEREIIKKILRNFPGGEKKIE
ncbi:MAG: phosphatase PAP2 family protein [Campylobacterales bacterium]